MSKPMTEQELADMICDCVHARDTEECDGCCLVSYVELLAAEVRCLQAENERLERERSFESQARERVAQDHILAAMEVKRLYAENERLQEKLATAEQGWRDVTVHIGPCAKKGDGR